MIDYALEIDGKERTIQLQKNRNLFGKDYTETHYAEDGSRVTTSTNYEDHCYYHGNIEDIKDSTVSVGICSGISGFVRARQQVYLIEPLEDNPDGDHAVYRQELLRTNSTVTYDHDQDPSPKMSGLFKSKAWKSKTFTGPARFIELYVVVDNTEFKKYGSQTKSRIFGVVNHVDKLYRALNFRVILVGLEIWTVKDHINVDLNSETTLDRFLLWRKSDLLNRSTHDNTQFVTGIDFFDDTVGLANKFAMCTTSSGAVNQDHNVNPIGLASTIAHEMGHNLGMSHDESPSCTCGPFNTDNCIMSTKLKSVYPEFFSVCSLEQLSVFLERAKPICLQNIPSFDRRMDVGRRCGNALLDPGEECDCGTVEECKNPCCDATTCRLTAGARCAHGGCCENCQLKQAAIMCRRSANECDLPEYCTGQSEYCPEDSFEMNGKPCDHGQGYCYNGQCPTLQQHCRRLFGPEARVGSDACFSLTNRGYDGAHCGKTEYGYARCTKPDMKCGSIFCEGKGDSITGRKAVFTVPGAGTCLIAVEDDKTRNFDMVPTGTRCGANKVCYDNKCVATSVYGTKEECSKKCNYNGICNHKGECQCNPGWAPPYCNVQYADLPQGQNEVIVGVSATVAVLLLLALLVTGLLCCKKNKREKYTSKRKIYSTERQLNPMFNEVGDKGKPQISQPTFIESTATQACSPLFVTVVPSRPPPQSKPPPPPKSLPPMNSSLVSHDNPNGEQ
ncbi:disintegrin and metalloproteinase domain-containing protein 8-like [Aplochiton taeniatus]